MRFLFKAKNCVIFFFVAFLVLPVFFGLFFLPTITIAEEDLSVACEPDAAEIRCNSLDSIACRSFLEKCEKFYNNQSVLIEKDITKTSTQKATLQNKVNSLNQKIKNLTYQIKQSNIVISDLKVQIQDTSKSIETTSQKIENSKARLADILRNIGVEDNKSLIEILFTENDLSGFYSNLVALDSLNNRNKKILDEIKALKGVLDKEKESLDGEKGDLERTVRIQTLQKVESDKTKKEQEQSLKLTEQQYQKQLTQKQEIAKKVAEIRSRIFELSGVTKAPTFGQAYEIAKYVSGQTGIRPAFLLAVLTQESNIGKNVGQCYLKNSQTGAGTNIKSSAIVKNVMKPMGVSGRRGDVESFMQITSELGKAWDQTAVSCPMSFGYGGAMGPAQFIPTTWVLYSDKIKNVKGSVGDPWNIQDAFLAAGLYLTNFGAKSQTYSNEWGSAMAYFSGSTRKNSAYNFYANSVMKIAAGYEDDIKAIEDSK